MIRRFNRYELKYIVTSEQRDLLVPSVLEHMSFDREGDEAGRYEVTSLYHDTFDLACYRAKIDGINYRRKLRIRRYGAMGADNNNLRVMVEIKQRINRTTQKRRLALPLSDAYALCGDGLERSFEDPLDRAVAEEVTFLCGARQLVPTCLIAYRRQAFMGSGHEPGLRITFDENLRACSAAGGLFGALPEQTFIPRDRLILEVKSNDVVPLWVSRLFARHNVRVARFSKYCAGIAWERRLRWTS